MYEPPYSFDFSPAPNHALALSYRLGEVCLASLLLLPVAFFIIIALTIVYDSHDAPPEHDLVLGLAVAPIVLSGIAGAALAIRGTAQMYRQGSGVRRAARAGLRGILSAIPTEEVGAAISDNREPITRTLPRASLTPEEQDNLLADLAAAYAIEFPQADHMPGPAAQPTPAPDGYSAGS